MLDDPLEALVREMTRTILDGMEVGCADIGSVRWKGEMVDGRNVTPSLSEVIADFAKQIQQQAADNNPKPDERMLRESPSVRRAWEFSHKVLHHGGECSIWFAIECAMKEAYSDGYLRRKSEDREFQQQSGTKGTDRCHS